MMYDTHSDAADDPVDLNHLRDITDGEKEIEQELFELFFSNAEECMSVLRSNCSDGENLKWRSAAHELKGSSASLGAFKLSKVCGQAQTLFTGSAQEKETVLSQIGEELSEVKVFLDQISYS